MNRLVSKLGIKHPIIQAPMLGVATPEMVAAAAQANCLGSLPLGDLNSALCAQKIRETKKLTNKPFAVNIFTNKIPAITEQLREKYNRVKNHLYALSKELNYDVLLPEIDEIKPKGYKDQLEAIIEEKCKILSFTFGNLDNDSIELLHNHNITLIGTCNSVAEAVELENSGIDIICVQGLEAGGHRGTFEESDIPLFSGFSLLHNVKHTIKTPLIYAGGITSKASIDALALLGAEGFQVGSLLLCSEESALQTFQKERIKRIQEDEIILTNSFSGRYARGLNNKFIALFENSEYTLPYPYQNKLTKPFRDEAKKKMDTEWLSLWVGQSINSFSVESTAKILTALI